jgi:hypothetical protein
MNEPSRTISDGPGRECETPTFSIGLEVEGVGVSHVPVMAGSVVVSACEKTTLKNPSCVGAGGWGNFREIPAS